MLLKYLHPILIFSITLLIINTNSLSPWQYSVRANTEDYDRWAVIIGVSEYLDPERNDLRSPAYIANQLYQSLQNKDTNWTDGNMLLLLNETATKQNILTALNWLTSQAGTNDTILFFFTGHGYYLPDQNHDEIDHRDEVICPYDATLNNKKKQPQNFISDDELAYVFQNISGKNINGMFLVFDTCFSGGLINWKNKAKSTDINPLNSVVLTSTIGHGIAISYGLSPPYITCGQGVIQALEQKKTQAEYIARYAQLWFSTKPVIFLYPFLALLEQLRLLLEHQALIFPFPRYKDSYPTQAPASKTLSIIT